MKKNFITTIIISTLVLCFSLTFVGVDDVFARFESNFNQTMVNDGGGGSGTADTGTTEDEDSKPAWLSSEKVTCGPVKNIPKKAPEIVSLLILLLQIAVPVILVIFGMIDLAKGVISQKDDEIKKGQQTFIKRLIVGSAIFLIVALVKLLVGVVGDTAGNKQNIVSCINCFINGECTADTSSGDADGGGGADAPSPIQKPNPNVSYEKY